MNADYARRCLSRVADLTLVSIPAWAKTYFITPEEMEAIYRDRQAELLRAPVEDVAE